MPAQPRTLLVVSAFSEPLSAGGALETTLAAEAAKAGFAVLTSNLYALKFNAVAFPDDFRPRQDAGYFSLDREQRAAYLNGTLPAQVTAEQGKLNAADALILLCPVLWGGPPAILKGWMEQVLTPVFAYDRGMKPMAGKQALFVAQGGGRMGCATEEDAQKLTVSYFEPLCRQGLAYCGFDVLPTLALTSPGGADEARKTAYVRDSVNAILAELGRQPRAPGGMPSPRP